MRNQTAAVKTRNRVNTDSKVDEQVMKVGFAALCIGSCAIGVWSLISLAGGMIASGGPLALVANWFTAVLG